MATKGLDDKAYRKRTAALRAKRLPCWICGKPIDYTLPYTDKMSFTADHVDPRAHGGALLGELQPAHRSCNSRRGKHRVRTTPTKTTRQWL